MFRNEPPSVVLEILSGLASGSRFDMAIMFMSSAEKKSKTVTGFSDVSHTYHLCFVFFNNTFCLVVLTDLFDFLQQAELEKSSVAALRKKYGM